MIQNRILPPITPETDVTYLVDNLLAKAIKSGTSAIHCEPQQDAFIIRFRIEGTLHQLKRVNKVVQQLIVSRIKVIANLDFAEHNLPQDGHFEFTFGMRTFTIRVSVFPTIYGEAVVLMILNREDMLRDLTSIGLDNQQLEDLNRLSTIPAGMLLTIGPHGSGKTTLLYSLVNVLIKPDNSILTIENPVELQIKNIKQTQINESTGFTFARAARSSLYQDADIILIGELEERESTQIALQTALTGKLVLSSLHSVNVSGVIARFIEMGIPRSVIASSINGIITTRLLRIICTECKTAAEPVTGRLQQNVYIGKGCSSCFNTGYFGRTGIYEIIPFDEEIRSAITDNTGAVQLSAVLQKKSHKSLSESARDKIRQGLTTVEEAERILGPFL